MVYYVVSYGWDKNDMSGELNIHLWCVHEVAPTKKDDIG